MGKRKKHTKRIRKKHDKQHPPKSVRGNWFKIFFGLKKELQYQEVIEREVNLDEE